MPAAAYPGATLITISMLIWFAMIFYFITVRELIEDYGRLYKFYKNDLKVINTLICYEVIVIL